MLEIGKIQQITGEKFGHCRSLPDKMENVLLPAKYTSENTHPLVISWMCLYILTMKTVRLLLLWSPMLVCGWFRVSVCKNIKWTWSFLDWGIAKDVFVPYAEQSRNGNRERYLVYLLIDEFSGRIAATAKVDAYLHDASNLQERTGSSIVDCRKTPFGI